MNYYYDCEVLADRIEELEELINESNNIDMMLEGRNRVIAELEKDFSTLNICDVMDWIYVTFDKEMWSQTWDWECEKVKQFCENFNVYLYEKPKEDFFEWEGIEQAERGGFDGVIFSNLS